MQLLRTESIALTQVKAQINEKGLEEIYQKSFNLDICLIKISLLCEGINDFLTESLGHILMCENEEIKYLALAIYIQSTKPALLIESEPFFFNFEINKDVTLRSILGDERFTHLINKTVELIGT